MCGLVGMAGKIGRKETKMFRDMLIFDTVRGQDSTGVATITPVANLVDIYTELGAPTNLWEYTYLVDGFDNRGLLKAPGKCVIGHNRAATIGKVTVENAHPFHYGKIVGAHNGSLRNWFDLAGAKDFDVDSKALINNIDVNGIHHTWENFFGAAAITYFDTENNTLCLIRNDERPLYVWYSKDRNTLFWASESWMIQVAAMRAEVVLCDKPVFLKEDQLHTYNVEKDTIKLLGSEALKKKSYPTAVKNTSTKSTGVTGNGRKKKRESMINASWSNNFPTKAEKSVRGTNVRLAFLMRNHSLGDVLFVCFDDQKNKYYIFPKTQSELLRLESYLRNGKMAILKINCRPRICGTSEELVYGLEARYAALSHYTDRPDEEEKKENFNLTPEEDDYDDSGVNYVHATGKVTKLRWEQLVKSECNSGKCISCDGTLRIEDHMSIGFINSNVALCPTCMDDDFVVGQLENVYNVELNR